MIRPERIALQGPTSRCPPGHNAIGGTVSQVVYLGACTQVHVDVGAPTALIVEVPNQSGPALGDPPTGNGGHLRLHATTRCGCCTAARRRRSPIRPRQLATLSVS